MLESLLYSTDIILPSIESAHLPPVWPGFNSRTRHHMWVEFVVGSLLCSERFFAPGTVFLLSSKTNISKFQFDPGMHTQAFQMSSCELLVLRGYTITFTFSKLRYDIDFNMLFKQMYYALIYTVSLYC